MAAGYHGKLIASKIDRHGLGTPLLGVALAAVLPSLLLAEHPKTDSVKLANGNVINGEIKRLERGLLTVKTDSMGSPQVKWEDVRAIESGYTYEISLTDGTVHVNALKTGPKENGLLVTGPGGDELVPFPRVVRLIEIESRVLGRLNGSIDLGYSFLKANTATQFNLNSELKYVMKKREAGIVVDGIVNDRSDAAATRRVQVDGFFQEFLRHNNFVAALAQFSKNEELQLDRRGLFGGAFGHYGMRTNRVLLHYYGGGAYSREHYLAASPRSNAELLAGVAFQAFRLSSPKMDVTSTYRVWPNLRTRGRVRMDLDIKARFEIFRNFFWSASFFDSFDNKTPGTGAVLNDFGIQTSIGYTFNR